MLRWRVARAEVLDRVVEGRPTREKVAVNHSTEGVVIMIAVVRIGGVGGGSHVSSRAGRVSGVDASFAAVFVDLGLKRGDGLLKTFQGERFGGRLSVGRTPRGREGIAAIVGGAEITALMIRARIAAAVEVLAGLVALILRARITALVIGTRSREAVGAEVPSVGAGSKAIALRAGYKCCLIGARHKDISRAAENRKRFGKRSDKSGGLEAAAW